MASERTNFDPLGFGLVRPFARTSTSDFASRSGEDLVRATVGQILGTAIGELPWRPNFGTTLSKLKHMRNTSQLPELARLSIQEALARWEPRVTISDISAEPVSIGNENKVLLSIAYRVANSNPTAVKVLI